MRITFIEPGASPNPVGGTKVVYEYANRLAARGHAVTVVHPVAVFPPKNSFDRFRRWSRFQRWRISGRWRPDSWMSVSPSVRMVWVPGLDARHVPLGDAVLAATWRTAEHVTALPPTSGRKFYLIQLWETGTGPDVRVAGAWKLPLTKIVIAQRYLEIARRLDETAVYIPNGLDTMAFGIDTPPEARDPTRIAMLYHRATYKGSADGLEALRLARMERPGLTADLYGVPPAPPDLPDWITYHRRVLGADLRRLLNRACIFISPSHNEGWGLPPCEAQLCGCALAITDNDGHREFAVDGETALLSPIGDPAALAANIVRLIDDADLRRRLTLAGLEKLGCFDWERSCDALEAVLKGDDHAKIASH